MSHLAHLRNTAMVGTTYSPRNFRDEWSEKGRLRV